VNKKKTLSNFNSTVWSYDQVGPITRLSLVYSAQFTLIMCAAAKKNVKNAKKTLKLLFGGTMSFKVINVHTAKTTSLVLVMISSMSVPKCNRFYARRANSGK